MDSGNTGRWNRPAPERRLPWACLAPGEEPGADVAAACPDGCVPGGCLLAIGPRRGAAPWWARRLADAELEALAACREGAATPAQGRAVARLADECWRGMPAGVPAVGAAGRRLGRGLPGVLPGPLRREVVVMPRRRQLNQVLHVPDGYRLSGFEDHGDHCTVEAARGPAHRERPACGARGHVHARRKSKVYHLPLQGRPLVIFLERVRSRCPACGKTYNDRYGDLLSSESPRTTEDLVWAIRYDIVDKMSMAAISRKEGPSVTLCNRVLDGAELRAAYLPRVLCIDEFKANTDAGRMSVGVADGDVGRLVEILERPRGDCLGDFFSRFTDGERARVEYFCCDMSPTFIAAQRLWFPKAKLCLDRFHVVKEVTGAFDRARNRIADSKEADEAGNPTSRDKFTAAEKKELRRARHLFRTRREELERIDFEYSTGLAERRARMREILADVTDEELDGLMPRPRAPRCAKVDALLEWDINLKVAYDLLQLFYSWDALPWCAEKRDGLEEWCRLAMRSPLPEFKTAAKTFRKNREGILNGYRYKKTNATAEGLNNTIKLLKKNAYGFKSFERMRRRCLFSLGYYRLSKVEVRLRDIRIPGQDGVGGADGPSTGDGGAK